MWSYDGETGPQSWGHLAPEFQLCSLGQRQSPINLVQTTLAEVASHEITLDYRPVAASIGLLDGAVTATLEPGCTAVFGEARYDLVQFHFHTPSEHTVDRAVFVGELHFVHFTESGEIAVLAAFVDVGENNAVVAQLINALLPPEAGKTRPIARAIDPGDLVPARCRGFLYEGSRTMPPCQEGVLWAVAEAHIEIGPGQVAAIVSTEGQNSRPTQPWNGRSVGATRIQLGSDRE